MLPRALPLALAALALARRRPARYVVRFPAMATLASVVPRVSRWRRLVPPVGAVLGRREIGRAHV